MSSAAEARLYRSVGFFKQSSMTAIVDRFSTRQATPAMLRDVFKVLGKELRLATRADKVYHLFINPDMNEIHILDCLGEDDYHQKLKIKIVLDFCEGNPISWLYFAAKGSKPDGLFGETRSHEESGDLWSLIGSPEFYIAAPFYQEIPLGYFVLAWNSPVLPRIFKDEEVSFREGITNSLIYIHGFVAKLFANHFPLHRNTYLPSYMRAGSKKVAILFADIRNFTEAFEAMRLHKSDLNPLVGLIKAYLDAASLIIAQPGIGTINKFIGDGIMATFGEYINCGESKDRSWSINKEIASCLLSLYSAYMLHDAFDKLFLHLCETDPIVEFKKSYNERLDLKVGVGINFGDANFDYFGAPTTIDKNSSKMIGGYMEFTAIGDNVNTAQRLESIANKSVSDVSVVRRSKHFSSSDLADYTAPILLSRTAFLRMQRAFDVPKGRRHDDLDRMLSDYYRSLVNLKGKGIIAEAYEIHPDDILWGEFWNLLKNANIQRINIDELHDRYFNEGKGRFEFPEHLSKKLIDKYSIK